MELKQIIVPIVLFVCITYGFSVLVGAVVRILVIRDGASDALVASIVEGEARARRFGALQWGLNLVCLAIAFAVIELARLPAFSAGALALVLGALGVANLGHFALVRRLT
ncbi:hypothetical protein ACFFGH_17365 [Lysobacter korlensis]|uniref:DUF3784 domain-containing protein n=1 Tax=Lysobacter korlensis TaxID=553636 RepID=A0ABV6RRK5_9GAMM